MDFMTPLPYGANNNNGGGTSWFSQSDFITRIMGFSFIASLFGRDATGEDSGGSSAFTNSVWLLILGALFESGRRLFDYVVQRFQLFQYSITAQFSEGDPAYEWLILLLTEEKVWSRSRQFRVSATSSLRKWTVNVNDTNKTPSDQANAEYVPTYEESQLFKWKGYWAEIRRAKGTTFNPTMGNQVMVSMYLTIYTRNMSILSAIVEDARERYVKTSRPHVIVHSADQPAFGPQSTWSHAKSKQRRPLSSIILQEGVIQSLIEDAREFIKAEDWYTKAGIPHRRGYLLHGPPGTGKSSTIYAVAGELGLEIYSLSLASGFVDDAFLQRAVSAIPKQAIFLIEDIDCAFPSREDEDDDGAASNPIMAFPTQMMMPGRGRGRHQRSPVTMSGLLNVLDGVGSEEGKLFFATTNYIDRLDPALLRPGRIDMKIQYKLATKAQAAALFLRFYPESYTTLASEQTSDTEKPAQKLTSSEREAALAVLAEQFSAQIPEHEFSTAELQGFLLSCKRQPEKAVAGVAEWVAAEKAEREAKEKREQEREAKKKEKKEAKEVQDLAGTLSRLGNFSQNVNGGGFGGGGRGGGRGQDGEQSVAASANAPPPNTMGGPVGPAGGPVGVGAFVPSSSTNIPSPPTAAAKPQVNGFVRPVGPETNGDSALLTPPTAPSTTPPIAEEVHI